MNVPKWVPYAVAAFLVWYFFIRRKVAVSGGFNVGAAGGNNLPSNQYQGYPPGVTPPGAMTPPTTVGGFPVATAPWPSGSTGTSAAQDAGAVLSGIGNLAGGLFGSGGLGGFLGSLGVGSSGGSTSAGSYPVDSGYSGDYSGADYGGDMSGGPSYTDTAYA